MVYSALALVYDAVEHQEHQQRFDYIPLISGEITLLVFKSKMKNNHRLEIRKI